MVPMMLNVIGAGEAVLCAEASADVATKIVQSWLGPVSLTLATLCWPLLDQYLISFILLHPTFRQFLEILQQTCHQHNSRNETHRQRKENETWPLNCARSKSILTFFLSLKIKYLQQFYVDLLYSCVCNI